MKLGKCQKLLRVSSHPRQHQCLEAHYHRYSILPIVRLYAVLELIKQPTPHGPLSMVLHVPWILIIAPTMPWTVQRKGAFSLLFVGGGVQSHHGWQCLSHQVECPEDQRIPQGLTNATFFIAPFKVITATWSDIDWRLLPLATGERWLSRTGAWGGRRPKPSNLLHWPPSHLWWHTQIVWKVLHMTTKGIFELTVST